MECADPDFPGIATRTDFILDFVQTYVCAWDGAAAAPAYWNCNQANPLPPTVAPTVRPEGATWIAIEIFLDVWYDEIAWNLRDLNTNDVVAGVPMGDYFWEDEVRHFVEVVPGHSYRFTIQDDFGDGIVMEGYYQILWTDQTLVLGVGAFGSERSHDFAIPQTEAPSEAPTSIEEECLGFGMPCDPMIPCCSDRCELGKCRHPVARISTRPKMSRGRGGSAGRLRGE
jgi:hypothetical protein